MPLAHDHFLVGLLFLEEVIHPSEQVLADLTAKTFSDRDALVRCAERFGILQLLPSMLSK
jgi:hypothetical protein